MREPHLRTAWARTRGTLLLLLLLLLLLSFQVGGRRLHPHGGRRDAGDKATGRARGWMGGQGRDGTEGQAVARQHSVEGSWGLGEEGSWTCQRAGGSRGLRLPSGTQQVCRDASRGRSARRLQTVVRPRESARQALVQHRLHARLVHGALTSPITDDDLLQPGPCWPLQPPPQKFSV